MECETCGSESTTVMYGDECPTCLRTRCVDCGEMQESTRDVNGSAYCFECSFQCCSCREFHANENIEGDVLAHDSCDVCTDCAEWCDDCDIAVIRDEHRGYHDEDDEVEEYNGAAAEPIRNYSYKPPPYFHGFSDENLYFGMEHEMEVSDRQGALETIKRYNPGGFFYVKSDSSLSGDGFEMVSHPFTREWFDTNYPQELIRELQREFNAGPKDYNGTERAGIHIHVSSAAFTTYHLYKFLHFHFEFAEMIQRVAGRAGSHWASFDKGKLGSKLVLKDDGTLATSQHAKLKALAGKKEQNSDRYMCVNLQNEQTVELRYFRSTGKIERVRAYVQFVDAVYHYTKVARLSEKAKKHGRVMSEADFMAYLRENAGRFPDTLNLLNRQLAYKPD